MFEQKSDDFVLGRVVVGVKAELSEVAVLADHVRRAVGEFGVDVSQSRFIEWSFQVLDHGEIDIAFFEKGDRPSGLASTRVEVQRHVLIAHV